MADQYTCLTCQKAVTGTKNLRYRSHTNGDGEPCPESSAPICKRELDAGPLPEDNDGAPIEGRDYARCHLCSRTPEIDRDGLLAEHLGKGKGKCPSGGRKPVPRKSPASTSTSSISKEPETTPEPSSSSVTESPPADEPPGGTSVPNLARASAELSTALRDVGAALPAPRSAPPSSRFLQPGPVPVAEPSLPPSSTPAASRFLQPAEIPPKVKAEMSDRGKEIANRLREIFYAYDNRKTSDNRSAQVTLGPSEIGTPCDRRLGMNLMRVPAVNPGGDGWAAFVGTCGHDGLEKMFSWADAGTGRFATEIPLTFGSAFVPKGTGDLLDRTLMVFGDHKFMGEWSLRKFKEKGPSDTYRVQVHTYALGATLAGEKVRDVAIIAWPRAGSSLDDLWVWTEKYQPKVAKDAITRVEKLAGTLPLAGGKVQQMGAARQLPIADKFECRYCPFHLKGDVEMTKGCPGA